MINQVSRLTCSIFRHGFAACTRQSVDSICPAVSSLFTMLLRVSSNLTCCYAISVKILGLEDMLIGTTVDANVLVSV